MALHMEWKIHFPCCHTCTMLKCPVQTSLGCLLIPAANRPTVGYWSSGTFALTVWAIQKRKADAVIATYSQAIPLENIFSLERRAHITGKRSSPSDRRRGSSLGDVVALKMRRNVSFLTHRSCHECVLLANCFHDLWNCDRRTYGSVLRFTPERDLIFFDRTGRQSIRWSRGRCCHKLHFDSPIWVCVYFVIYCLWIGLAIPQ